MDCNGCLAECGLGLVGKNRSNSSVSRRNIQPCWHQGHTPVSVAPHLQSNEFLIARCCHHQKLVQHHHHRLSIYLDTNGRRNSRHHHHQELVSGTTVHLRTMWTRASRNTLHLCTMRTHIFTCVQLEDSPSPLCPQKHHRSNNNNNADDTPDKLKQINTLNPLPKTTLCS